MYIVISDLVNEEEFAKCILRKLESYVYDGMTTGEFYKLLKKHFGVTAKYCCDLIQKMKIELDMYCPNRQHLYLLVPD